MPRSKTRRKKTKSRTNENKTGRHRRIGTGHQEKERHMEKKAYKVVDALRTGKA